MSFPVTHTQKKPTNQTIYRKENGSRRPHHTRKRYAERASACALPGSLSVEAALAAPFFFFTLLSFVCLFEIMATKSMVKHALQVAGRELAVESVDSTLGIGNRLEKKMVSNLGSTRLQQSYIKGKASGLDCGSSKVYPGTTILKLTVDYGMEFPVFGIAIPLVKQQEKILVKGWTGYEGNGFYQGNEEAVYITPTGLVYHKDPSCSYLDLSIRKAKWEDVEKSYRQCKRCRGTKMEEWVYVTEYGECYHMTLSCSGLKRTVYKVPISEVFGRGGCQKCTK